MYSAISLFLVDVIALSQEKYYNSFGGRYKRYITLDILAAIYYYSYDYTITILIFILSIYIVLV
ncbi:unnamed protein product [Cercospora beticola]|nr:unnamed protein product [Cercospora beticola]